jgi:thiamine kinase-like enzyme
VCDSPDPTNEQQCEQVLARCQAVFPTWQACSVDDFDFDDPKGFSSFTMGVRTKHPRSTEQPAVDPPAVLYRQLAGKENAILDFDAERELFLLLGRHEIAAQCYHYDNDCRIEQFYQGRTLTVDDVLDADIQRQVAGELFRFHRLDAPAGVPKTETFFQLLHQRWGPLTRSVLGPRRSELPADEQALCDDLVALDRDETIAKVLRCLPDRPPVLCHNDTYHGNVFLCDDGTVKLLDFEFSCLNQPVFDFANFFAETTLEHGLTEPPYFRLVAPRFTEADLASFLGFYVDRVAAETDELPTTADRDGELESLLADTRRAIMLSDYMYAMAAIPLALEPIQKIRFIPYAHQRFQRFLASWDREFIGS